ncbi:hypothetical protein RJT34_25638 [Clitoria ternatea]|uniref:Pre-mRNA-splicing factor SYF2 n=1 Tax=Clitoria ternatea TaxID=43366 RepID=A0AAN9FQ75_CLITE
MGVSFCFTVRLVGITSEAGDTQKEMAQNARVMSNCVYAPNPYHECTEACLQKIKETKPTKNKKSSGYRRSVTDGELGKKMNEDKHTHSGCPKASNPYHVCDEYCHKRMSGADSGAVSFGRKKKVGSKPELPVLDSVPASKIGAIYLSDASSPLSNYSENKKEEPKSNVLIPVSGELRVLPNVMDKDTNNKVQSKDVADHVAGPIRTKQDVDKNASPKVVPITSVDDTGSLTKSGGGSMDFCFSGGLHDNEDSDGGETGSVVSESRVPVGRYHVKESFAPILMSIFEKYGDIGASCHLESVVMRSYYIECVCFVVQELTSTPIVQLTRSKVKELLAILKDVESAQLRVAWLRSIVDEIAENVELINEHHAVEVAKANSDREMESLRKELESKLETLAQKEQEVSDIKTRIEEIRERLSELEVKSSDLDKNMLSIKSKVDNLDSKSLLEDLLDSQPDACDSTHYLSFSTKGALTQTLIPQKNKIRYQSLGYEIGFPSIKYPNPNPIPTSIISLLLVIILQGTVSLHNNMTDERAVHPDCRNASNPFHECSDYCFRVIAEAKIRMQEHESEVAQAHGGSGSKQAIQEESHPDDSEEIQDDRPNLVENSDSDPDQPPAEQVEEVDYTKLSTRQKKWMELRAKMQEAKKRNQVEIAAEKKRMEAPTESRGVSKQKWFEDRKKKIGKLLDANGLDMTKAYMLDTQEAAEGKYKKWEKDPAPFGWDVFNQKTLYNAYKKRTKKIEVDVEEYNRMKEADPEFYREASSLQYGKAPKISEDKIDRMVQELKDRDEKRKSFSRRRRFHEEKDIDSINDRNEHFNKKIERAFGKYTLEIKNNLERGTALPD